MRPVLQNKKLNKKRLILYILIFLICLVGIGISLYFAAFQDEKIGTIVGITDDESEKEDEYNSLKSEFDNLFTNDLEILQEPQTNIKKINAQYDLVVTAYEENKNEENLTLNAAVPQINLEKARSLNTKIRKEYIDVAKKYVEQTNNDNIIYSVSYKAYVQNNILSIAIRSEFKEGEKSQKVLVKTINFNLEEDREATITDLLKLKNIKEQDATNKIRKEIKKIQEQNLPLIEQGYPFYERDYKLDMYEINNVNHFLYGKNGMLYVIFPYGNEEETSEMDIVIFI